MANPKRASLAELLTPVEPEGQGAEVLALDPVAEVPSGAERRSAAEKAPADFARVGLYLHPAVAKEIKLVAFSHDCKAHDIYLEAVDLVLRKYGRKSIKELSAKV